METSRREFLKAPAIASVAGVAGVKSKQSGHAINLPGFRQPDRAMFAIGGDVRHSAGKDNR